MREREVGVESALFALDNVMLTLRKRRVSSKEPVIPHAVSVAQDMLAAVNANSSGVNLEVL